MPPGATPTAIIARCPVGMVPPWDFDVPDGPARIDDSSAAAIAASGLWNLARAGRAASDPSAAARYRNATLTILESLCTERYLAGPRPAGKECSNTASIISTKISALMNR